MILTIRALLRCMLALMLADPASSSLLCADHRPARERVDLECVGMMGCSVLWFTCPGEFHSEWWQLGQCMERRE